MVPGKFISLEGGEGAGKSTQAKLLRSALEARGHSVLLTREPGGSPGAEEIRKLLVEGEPERWTPLGETLLFLAARADHVTRAIAPALASGAWVISDRFADSTVVYQGIARGLGMARVRALQMAALGDFMPDLTLVLDVNPQDGLARAGARGAAENRFERFDDAFHRRLRDGFLAIAAEAPQRCAILDAAGTVDAVAAKIWNIVAERLRP
ncbi:MAG TPA: dTMP kinase [Micropepsaceae bacterium]|jgi:dTMP kinase